MGKEPVASPARRMDDLLARMTLDEKIGQMTQVEKNSISPEEVARLFIGSILSGGGGYPAENTPAGWAEMVWGFQGAALQTRLGIPLLYGVDAVHGHNNLYGAVIFPHNVGLGAARDPDLAYRIGRATAEELGATGIRWNFAPTIAVPQDLRWGRAYEGFAQDPQLVAELGSAYIKGLQGDDLQSPLSVLATAKHYVADGGTTWGTSYTLFPIPPGSLFEGENNLFRFMIDRGDTRVDETELRTVHLRPYLAAIQSGARIVMASFSSWNGAKMHAHRYLLTDVLKNELGFTGFIVSDWAGIEELGGDYDQAVAASINAGIDMSMVPMDFERFIASIRRAVESGAIPLERIDDAVRRIVRVKLEAGMFEQRQPDPAYFSLVGNDAHRRLGREAVSRSLVLLKNEGKVLPLSKSTPRILVGGQAADDIGLQCGGWTIEWLGKSGPITLGTTILEGIRTAVSGAADVEYDPDGGFERLAGAVAEVGIAVLAEMPYAEGFGDRADLNLPDADIQLIERMRPLCQRLVVLLLSGRPLVLTGQLPIVDGLVAAWLPGTEGQGVADVLFGDEPFSGRLPYSWPRGMDQVPVQAEAEPLYPFGHGLQAGGSG
ncbi:MAG TPA: glycoside hydrolase family 3 N-terminal domain-containing protein [Anaerolineales bacterium]|nr:glycoside hydrolase family 3 N-terminal domain-containing protein [Anaerolineales bacterium]